ncbi:putative protein FAM90A12P [Canis lupus familiaris]|uniref:putative protein FAM90A12P n=1 Tax=Canis lupus familiaris TaxID=9615 RepID=UPI0018F5A5C1|nr:putative protein FAM90A12P [Canis lupus familiaris]
MPHFTCTRPRDLEHKAPSTRCPVTHWGATFLPLALGSRRLKENVEPGSQRDQRHQAGLLNQAEREKAGRRRQEAEQRKALLHRFPRRPQEGQKRTWKEDTESCDYVRCPHMPMPVYTTRRPSIPEPALLMEPQALKLASAHLVDLGVPSKCRSLTPLCRLANPVSGLTAWKQTCPWMHSPAPADQEDTCPPSKQGPPAHTCHTSPGNAAAVHRAPTAALCAGPHSAPENGLHQIEQKLLELPGTAGAQRAGEASRPGGPHPVGDERLESWKDTPGAPRRSARATEEVAVLGGSWQAWQDTDPSPPALELPRRQCVQ